MLSAALTRRLGPERAVPATMALAAVAGCALVALVDPTEPGRYPTCPTQSLLGLDCPACGTLRGLHALSRGRLGAALDHNLLLAVAVPLGAVLWLQWVLAALGRPTPVLSPPRWLVGLAVAVAGAFTLLRNAPGSPLLWLDSAA